MSSYFSLSFLFGFLPLTLILYGVLPKRARWVVLLVASYVFFWLLSSKLIVFVLISTGVIYGCGRWMASLLAKRDAQLAAAAKGKKAIRQACKRRMRGVLVLGVLVNLALLIGLKYLVFFGEVATSLLSLLGVQVSLDIPTIGIPIGISFYTLMAISYLADVYRETVAADKHLGRVALFLVFFPQIMEGPICRYAQTAQALTAGEPLHRAGLYQGSLRILFGIAKKMVVADRLNVFVEPVFDHYAELDGGMVAAAAILYTFQLYCDFSGTMDIALGMGRMFNVTLPENFRQPFFSRTASEFWQRWHITLGTWLKDYVYYPVSLSKPCKNLTAKARKRFGNRYGPLLVSGIALFCVWVCNGLWHGAGSQYLFFGMYYFVLIMAGGLIDPVAQRLAARLHIDRNRAPYRAFQIARTLIVIFVGELFFRANGMEAGLSMFGTMVGNFSLDQLTGGAPFPILMDACDYGISAFCAVALLVVGIVRERGCNICETIGSRGALLRWGVWVALFAFLVIVGAYGSIYDPVDPMYAQF